MGGKGGHHPSSSESDDWGDESWIVECPCGVTFDDGEEMVDCDECGVWVHTACCKVAKHLPTYVCDKCKAKKILKDAEESEVAQLLADFPSKPISFEERNHEKADGYMPGHHPASEVPIEARAHVHGIPGGDPSFFVGVSKVFCRQLWKYTGYVPKHLKVDHKELPEPREDVVELLRDLQDFTVPVSMNDRRKKLAPLPLENGHALSAVMGTLRLQKEPSRWKEEGQLGEAVPKDRHQSKNFQAKKGEGKPCCKHGIKPKVADEKLSDPGKRGRDEGPTYKEQQPAKKLRENRDASMSVEPEWTEVETASSLDAGLSGKSPLSSPKNPKAMKKLAVQEFMDADVIVCDACGKTQSIRDIHTGDSTGPARPDSLCQKCGRTRGFVLPVVPKLETGAVSQKSHPPSLSVAGVNVDSSNFEASFASTKDADHGETMKGRSGCKEGGSTHRLEVGVQPSDNMASGQDRVCGDSPADVKHPVANVTENLKGVAVLEPMKEEKRKVTVKLEPNEHSAKQPSLSTGSGAGEGLEELDHSAVKGVVTYKARRASAASRVVEDERGDAGLLPTTRPNGTDEAETRRSGFSDMITNAMESAVTGNEVLPVSSSKNVEPLFKPNQPPSEGSPVVPVVLPTRAALAPNHLTHGNGFIDRGTSGRGSVLTVDEGAEEKASKLPGAAAVAVPKGESRGQGSARTAGHLPASVRGKIHGERCNNNQQVERSESGGVAGQQQGSGLAGHIVASGTQKSALHAGSSLSVKGSAGEDLAQRKHHEQQVQADGVSPPVHQTVKHSQQVRPPQALAQAQAGQQVAATKWHKAAPTGSSETSSSSQHPSCSPKEPEMDQLRHQRGQAGSIEPAQAQAEAAASAASSKPEAQAIPALSPDRQVSNFKTLSPSGALPAPPVLCQQACQLNGVGNACTGTGRFKASGASTVPSNHCVPSSNPLGEKVSNWTLTSAKASAGSLKSLSSGTSSSSPTSPLVTTPSSRFQQSNKVSGSPPPPQKSVSSGSIHQNHTAPHSSSTKVLASTTSLTTPHSKQGGALHPVKSVPAPSPHPAKIVSRHSSRTSSLPVVKGSDVGKPTPASGATQRGANHSGPTSGWSGKDHTTRNVGHTNNKVSAGTGKAGALSAAVVRPPSTAKSSHNFYGSSKGSSAIKHSGPRSGSSKTSTQPLSTTKHASAAHHSKGGSSHKDEKSSLSAAAPLAKSASVVYPIPHVSTKRSPPTAALPSAVALKDEELALLLHQELNSSPRVPRVPRVRQAGASLALVSTPPLSGAKGSHTSATGSGGSSYKDNPLASRKRTREDRQKESSKRVSHSSEDVWRVGGRRVTEERRVDDGKGSTERGAHSGITTGSNNISNSNNFKEKSAGLGSLSTVEGNVRHHGFGKGSLSIIVPEDDDIVHGDKKSPAESSFVTLPGLIDEVLNSRSYHLSSYEDVCNAVLPHWPKLRKPNGERYAYASHRRAVLDCLRNRSAWAHLVGRAPKTNFGRKRRLNESVLSDTDEEIENFGGSKDREMEDLDMGRQSKRRKGSSDVAETWEEEHLGDRLRNRTEAAAADADADAATGDDIPKGKRQARRRRRVAIEDGSDADDEPVDVMGRRQAADRVSKSSRGSSSQEEEEDEEEEEDDDEEEEVEEDESEANDSSHTSSDEAVSNFSEEDEEMVVRRGIRNRRRPADKSSGSEDDDID